jgi:hypothetical protein
MKRAPWLWCGGVLLALVVVLLVAGAPAVSTLLICRAAGLPADDADHPRDDPGNGKPTQGPAHTNSICVFSGLEDGEEGQPAGPGAPPQNWGHSKEAFGATRAERKASGFQPGDSCNGHRGFLAGGGGEPAP